MGHAFKINDEFEVDATPEQVWEGFAPIEGVVDYLSPSFLGVRTGDGLYRFIHGFDGSVVVGHHVFADEVDQKEAEHAWQSWLVRTFG